MKLTPEALELLLPKAPPPPLLAPTWATVTRASPLQVHVPGDPDPLDATPKTLVRGLRAGDMVWCVLQGTDLIVVGRFTPSPGGVASMTKTSTGPAYSANTWKQVTGFDTSGVVSEGITADPAAGTFTAITASAVALYWRQRWQYYGSAFRRQAAIVLGVSAPAADNSNVLSGNAAGASNWYTHTLVEPSVWLPAGAVVSFWVWSDTSSTYNNTTNAPVPPATKVAIGPALYG